MRRERPGPTSLTVGPGVALGAGTLVLVGPRVDAGAGVQAGQVGAAEVQVWWGGGKRRV